MTRIPCGIVGISGYGGGEALRLIAGHPNFDLIYAAGESSAGAKLVDKFPALSGKLADLVIQPWDPTKLADVKLLFASLPTGASQAALAQVPEVCKIVDIGGDHRYVDGWTYGLADVWPDDVRNQSRVANPGCYPAASLIALAPLLANKLIDPADIIIDAKSGVSGAGRGGSSSFGYAETNEDLMAYGLIKHTHMPEIASTIARLAGGTPPSRLVFTPHLIPMTRGILATVYCRSKASAADCFDAARAMYADRPFVRVTEKPPHTKWATGTNLAFVHYAADPSRELVIALCAIDNLGKGAAGMAVQNANLMLGLEETAGLNGLAVGP